MNPTSHTPTNPSPTNPTSAPSESSGDSIKLPKRRFSVVIECGGDTKDEAVLAIRDFADRIEAGQVMGITGAPSFGGSYKVTEDPEMTHERYFQAIEAMKGAAQ